MTATVVVSDASTYGGQSTEQRSYDVTTEQSTDPPHAPTSATGTLPTEPETPSTGTYDTQMTSAASTQRTFPTTRPVTADSNDVTYSYLTTTVSGDSSASHEEVKSGERAVRLSGDATGGGTADDTCGGGLSGGAIAALTVLAVVGFTLLSLGIGFRCRRRFVSSLSRRRTMTDDSDSIVYCDLG